jgi:8-oxo-dGTP pyrophosphatase MutT (NUDIX family)
MNDDRGDERLKKEGSKLVYRGPIASVRMETFQYSDGTRATRQVVVHPGAVCVIPHDGNSLYMVEQPREAVEEPALLELPAGKLDVEGETPLQCAQRELAEEIGKGASEWRELKRFYTSPGFAEEEVIVYLATDLHDASAEVEEEERLEIVAWPLAELDRAIEECRDSKSLVGMMVFRELRRS